ncbi:MAG: SMP-30/gluconolactonase/LRE family protein, partial [Bacteroidota bacterium]
TLLMLCFLLGYIFYSTGFFRSIENRFNGQVAHKIPIPGVEDLQISYEDHFALLSSDDRAARRDGHSQAGHLYYLDLRDPKSPLLQLTQDLPFQFYPHGISMVKIGENKYRIFAINHVPQARRVENSIEVFDLEGKRLSHIKTLKDPKMISPNDLVALDGERFYFSNDHGDTQGLRRLAEDYLAWGASNVVYFDGSDYKVVAENLAYANGINFDQKNQRLFVASTRKFFVRVFDVQEDGSLEKIEDIPCGTGVDNIEFGPEGRIWIGCHPSLLTFVSYAQAKRDISPSEIIRLDYQGKGDYQKDIIYLNDGQAISACSVAAPYEDMILVGAVMDTHFLILQEN